MIRSNQLQESETAYSEALGENAAARSTQSTRLHKEHVKHMHELEEQAIREENNSHHNFLSTCQAVLLHALQPLKENLSTSYHILLGRLPSSLQSAPFVRTPQAVETAILQPLLPGQNPSGPHDKKGSILHQVHGEARPWMRLPPRPHRRTIKLQKKRDPQLVHLPKAQLCRCLQP